MHIKYPWYCTARIRYFDLHGKYVGERGFFSYLWLWNLCFSSLNLQQQAGAACVRSLHRNYTYRTTKWTFGWFTSHFSVLSTNPSRSLLFFVLMEFDRFVSKCIWFAFLLKDFKDGVLTNLLNLHKINSVVSLHDKSSTNDKKQPQNKRIVIRSWNPPSVNWCSFCSSLLQWLR